MDWENFRYKGSDGEVKCLKREKSPDPPGLEPGTLLVMSNALTNEHTLMAKANLGGSEGAYCQLWVLWNLKASMGAVIPDSSSCSRRCRNPLHAECIVHPHEGKADSGAACVKTERAKVPLS